MKYVIVGAGLFGSVLAERIASILGEKVEIYEKRNHIGGNCNSFFDSETGIECHQYGCHIFHTSLPAVWEYINQFGEFTQYRHRVLTKSGGRVYSMPVNLFSINKLFDREMTPEAARRFVENEANSGGIIKPQNLEEKGISLVGIKMYDAFLKGYTEKQWGRSGKMLPEEILTRLPVRYSYNSDYFDDTWQGVPKGGYNALFQNMLSHPGITVKFGEEWRLPENGIPEDTMVFYTGMPDELFDCCHGRLDWRSLRFKWLNLPVRDFQGIGQMNYADAEIPFTRIHEYKHYHPERKKEYESRKTSLCVEYPDIYSEGKEAYYPVNDDRNNALYAKYRQKADGMSRLKLGGRLGSYRYWNMDKTIANALKLFEDTFNIKSSKQA